MKFADIEDRIRFGPGKLENQHYQSMKARMIMAAMAFVGCGIAMAQENRFSAGLELGLPMGDFGDAQGVGFGVSLGFELPVGDNLGVIAQAGYISFTAKDIEIDIPFLGTQTIEGATLGAIPIQVGAKYYFTENQNGVYLGVLTGIHLLTPEVGDSRTNFGIAPLLGIAVGESIDIALRYQMLFDSYETVSITGTSVTTETVSVTNSYLGLRAAWMFGSR